MNSGVWGGTGRIGGSGAGAGAVVGTTVANGSGMLKYSNSCSSPSLRLVSSCSANDKNVLTWVVNMVGAVMMSLCVALTSSSSSALLPCIVC